MTPLDPLSFSKNHLSRYLPCFFLLVIFQLSCSIPNLQTQQCAEAQDSVKQFYSWYLGTEPDARAKQPEVFKKYVSNAALVNEKDSRVDPFFNSDTLPTTFKIGKCEPVDDDHINVQVQLYWRYGDNRTDQKEVYADTIKNGDQWQIESVEGR